MTTGSPFPCNTALLETTAVWRKVFFQTLKLHVQEAEGTGRQPEQTEHSPQEPTGGREKEEVLQLLPRAATMTERTDRHVVTEAQ